MVGLQSTQARLDRGDYLLAVVAGTVRITRVGLVGELGGENEPVAAPFEQLAEDGFRRPVGVDVGNALTSGDAPQPQSSPKVMVPSATSEIRTPDLPKSL
jgi:hypothetical protein